MNCTFSRAWAHSRELFRVLREYGAGETPQAHEAPRRKKSGSALVSPDKRWRAGR